MWHGWVGYFWWQLNCPTRVLTGHHVCPGLEDERPKSFRMALWVFNDLSSCSTYFRLCDFPVSDVWLGVVRVFQLELCLGFLILCMFFCGVYRRYACVPSNRWRCGSGMMFYQFPEQWNWGSLSSLIPKNYWT